MDLRLLKCSVKVSMQLPDDPQMQYYSEARHHQQVDQCHRWYSGQINNPSVQNFLLLVQVWDYAMLARALSNGDGTTYTASVGIALLASSNDYRYLLLELPPPPPPGGRAHVPPSPGVARLLVFDRKTYRISAG